MRNLIKFIVTCLFIALLTACGNQETASKDYFATASAEAKSLYDVRCIACHATDLRGYVGEPSNLQKVGARLSKEDIINTIENGKGQMLPFKDKLSAEEIGQLADWLVTLR